MTIFKNRAVIYTALAVLIFWVLATFVDAGALKETSDALRLAISAAIIISWSPAVLRAYRQGGKTGTHQLIIGIVATFLTIFGQGVWIDVVRWLGRPDELVSSPFNAFVSLSMALAGMTFLRSPSVDDDGDVPWQTNAWLIGAVATGALLAGIMIGKFVLGGPPA